MGCFLQSFQSYIWLSGLCFPSIPSCAMPGGLATDEKTKAQRGKICLWLQSDGVAEVSHLPTPWWCHLRSRPSTERGPWGRDNCFFITQHNLGPDLFLPNICYLCQWLCKTITLNSLRWDEDWESGGNCGRKRHGRSGRRFKMFKLVDFKLDRVSLF